MFSPQRIRRQLVRLATAALAAGLLAGCQDVSDFSSAKHLTPVPIALKREIEANGMALRSPILLRIFKEESILEVWKETKAGRFELLKDYKICAWSGKPGPKIKEGDRQAPEGFYSVTPGQMNPNSSYYLSFNIGFPNAYDRSLNRTGTHIMVHGDCSSRGCYAMEDEGIEEIYTLAREAFAGGQRSFQVQAFPFRMTPENLAAHADSEHIEFWNMLKDGSDHFEVTGHSPKVDVCGKKYVFDAKPGQASFRPTEPCPAYTIEQDIERLVAVKRDADTEKMNLVMARMDEKAERERRWAEREVAVASFFGATKTDAATAAADGASSDGTSAALALGAVPVPKPAPGGPNRVGDGVAVASVAAVLVPTAVPPAGSPSAVAQLGGPGVASHPMTSVVAVTPPSTGRTGEPTPAGSYATVAAGYPTPAAGYPTPAAGYPPPVAGYPTPTAGFRTPAAGYPTPAAGAATPAKGTTTSAAGQSTPAADHSSASGASTPVGKSSAAAAAMAAGPALPASGAPAVTVTASAAAAGGHTPKSPDAARSSEAEAATLGFAAVEEEGGGGFLSSVAKSSQGLFRRAGSLF